MATKELYHIITFAFDCGDDEMPETRTLSDAIKTAKEYLATGWEEVKIYHKHELKRHYMRLRNGKIVNLPTNTPQTAETPQISTIGAKVESYPPRAKQWRRAKINAASHPYWLRPTNYITRLLLVTPNEFINFSKNIRL